MKEALRAALAAYQPQAAEEQPGLVNAAVLLLLYEREGHPHVVLQKRTEHVDTHKGQISFPGGMCDPGDPDLMSTALREAHEEIGVHPSDVEVLGRLDDIVTMTNFRVTPFVGWLSRYPYEWHVSDAEVEYLIEVGLDHLRHPETFIPDRRVVNGREFVFPSYRFRDDLIWGATARMFTNFLDVYTTLDAAD